MKDRIALVIGNSNYVHAGILTNPQNDANDIESVLNRLNFDVTKVTDTSLIDLQQAINTFLQDLDEYAVGLLFYAGHGMQIDGKNYIVPVDLMMSSKSRTQVSCYCFNSFLDEVAAYKGKTIICVLDACRTNPFVSNRGFTTGFAPFNNPPKGTIIAYSTSADCGAYDGMGSNGLYTILYILKNERYIGDALLEKKYTTDCLPYRQKKNNGEKPQYYVENYCPPIISREIFQAVQDMLNSKRKDCGTKRSYTLTQIMRCPDCGRAFRRQKIRGKAYWLCGQLASSAGKCKSRQVQEEMAYDSFTTMVYKLKANRESLHEKLIQRLEYLQSRTSENIERIRQIDKEIADLSAKNLVVTRLHTSGVLGIAEFTAQTSEISNKITELRIERRKKLAEDTALENRVSISRLHGSAGEEKTLDANASSVFLSNQIHTIVVGVYELHIC